MKNFALLFCMSVFSVQVMAQDASADKRPYPGKMSFYAELGGPGVLFSANIDSRFNKSNLGFGGRIGIGFVTSNGYTVDTFGYIRDSRLRSIVTIPVQVNYIFGKSNSVHSFEVGAGVTVFGKKVDIFDDAYYNDGKLTSLAGTASFMYRRQPKDGGFSWRIGFTPLITGGYIMPSGGVSVGYNF